MTKPQQFDFVSFGVPGALGQSGDDEFSEIDRRKYTKEDLEKAAKQNYDKGHQEGLAAGVEKGKNESFQLDKQINSSISAILQKIDVHVKQIEEIAKIKSVETIKLASLIAKKIAGDAIREDPAAKIESMVNKALPLIQEKVPATLFVNPAMTGKMDERIKKIISENKHAGTILVKEDKNLPESGCRFEWGGGGVEYNPENVWKEINKLLGIADFSDSGKTEESATKNPAENTEAKT